MTKQRPPRKQRCADCTKLTDTDMLCTILLSGDRHKLVCEPCMWEYHEPKDR